jgi:cystathionine beta-lyase/cystathionine gamma-synthase
LVGGSAITNREDLAERFAFIQNAVGAIPGPLDCFLTLRGIRTLPIRMDRHAENAIQIAEYLQARNEVGEVFYPFLSDHPQFELATRQMRNGGGMVSFVMKKGREAAQRFVESTNYFTLAESLGGVESLIELPALMTHASTANSPLEVNPSLVRLSVGLENVTDLIEDIDQALEK